MSKIQFVLRAVVFSLAGSVLVFLSVGQVLADEWMVETTRVMRVAPSRLAENVADLDRWPSWSSIDFQLGNPTTRSMKGSPGVVGQESIWSGPLGKAVVTLDAITAAGVEYRIGYIYEQGNVGGKFAGSISWRELDGDQVAVTWRERGELASLIERWANWFGALQQKVQQIQRASLAGLEERLADEVGSEAGK